ncbi:GGDEF domain-containing protein [Eubacterium pyruvativorans]|nr:GGDEF domain-containing protein [Eubacterium pyruvativorans]
MECTSAEALRSRSTVSKLETDGQDIFAVISRYLVLNGKPVVMEIAKRMDGSSRLAASEQEAFIQIISSCRRELYIDSLAQIHNRRYYDEIMSAEYVSAVAIIDIDGFKQINDEFGHLAGDEVLFRVGQAIDSCVRSEDEVRYGGDEFVVAFCEITRDCFEDKLKRILGEIGRIHLTRHPEIRLSVSIGGIHRRGFVRDLFNLADLALYRAKRQRGLYRIEE